MALKHQGTSQVDGVDLFDFQEFCRLIGFQDVWDFERKWALLEDPEGAPAKASENDQ